MGNCWLSAAVPITMGLRPYGHKSGGMATRSPWYAAATAAGGGVMEVVDLGASSP